MGAVAGVVLAAFAAGLTGVAAGIAGGSDTVAGPSVLADGVPAGAVHRASGWPKDGCARRKSVSLCAMPMP